MIKFDFRPFEYDHNLPEVNIPFDTTWIWIHKLRLSFHIDYFFGNQQFNRERGLWMKLKLLSIYIKLIRQSLWINYFSTTFKSPYYQNAIDRGLLKTQPSLSKEWECKFKALKLECESGKANFITIDSFPHGK